MKNSQMLGFVPDHLKIKKMWEHAGKKLIYYTKRYVTDWYNTQEMCDKSFLENIGTLEFVSDCYKNKKMCNKAVNIYAYALEFHMDCYKAQICVI